MNRTLEKSIFQSISHSDTLLINEAQDQLQATGQNVHKFGFGQSPFSPPKAAVEWLKQYADQHDYLPVAGLASLRDAVANAYQSWRESPISADDVVIAPGSKMIIYAIMACFKEATVLLSEPSWVSYAPQARLCGHHTHWIPSSCEVSWKLTDEALDQACRATNPDKPRVLVLNYPGNPTGMSYSDLELQSLAKVAQKHNIWIISDEIYSRLSHQGDHQSIARYYPDKTIITTGLSKWCGAGGWRLGLGIFPRQLDAEFKLAYQGIASETYSTTAAPIQLTARNIYQDMSAWEGYIQEQRTLLSTLAAQVVQILNAADIKVHQPDGGFYVLPDFSYYQDRLKKKGIHTASELCQYLLSDASVAVLPGSAFGCRPSQWVVRLCYVDFDGEAARTYLQQRSELTAADCAQFAPSVIKGAKAISASMRSL